MKTLSAWVSAHPEMAICIAGAAVLIALAV